jgi:diadenosine tetraphosphate (Ap4A) HIT family hydrolase
MAQKCPFCTQPDIKERTILKNKYVFAFPTNIPIVPGHVLITPVRHVATFAETTLNERKELFAMMAKLQVALKREFKAQGFNFAWNEGPVAGQTVMHFHLHLLPRKKGDEGVMKYEPREFLYRPGSRETSPHNELLAIAERIKKQIK